MNHGEQIFAIAERLAEPYEVFDEKSDPRESHGRWATMDEARGCVTYDRLKEWSIWRNGDDLMERSQA